METKVHRYIFTKDVLKPFFTKKERNLIIENLVEEVWFDNMKQLEFVDAHGRYPYMYISPELDKLADDLYECLYYKKISAHHTESSFFYRAGAAIPCSFSQICS